MAIEALVGVICLAVVFDAIDRAIHQTRAKTPPKSSPPITFPNILSNDELHELLKKVRTMPYLGHRHRDSGLSAPTPNVQPPTGWLTSQDTITCAVCGKLAKLTDAMANGMHWVPDGWKFMAEPDAGAETRRIWGIVCSSSCVAAAQRAEAGLIALEKPAPRDVYP